MHSSNSGALTPCPSSCRFARASELQPAPPGDLIRRPAHLIDRPPMPQDPLSDVLRSVRLRGAVFYYVSYRDDWVAEAPAARQIADAVMPGAEHVLEYHLMAKGEGWAATEGESPVRLSAGDIVMFPRGDAHVMSSAPGMRAMPDSADWVFAARDEPKPITVAYHAGVLRPGAPVPVD